MVSPSTVRLGSSTLMRGTASSAPTGAVSGSMRTVPVIRGAGGCGRGRDVAPRGRPDHAGADRDGYRQDGGDRGAGHHGAAALDPTGARPDVGDGERGALQGIGGAVQRVVHLVLEGSGAHRASSPDSWGLRECGARARSAASARLACDFTVPTEIPSTSAISASLSCS